jgi:hypothetical protein
MSDSKATEFDKSKLKSWDIRRHITDDVIEVINKPNPHEGEGNKPVWIIWDVRTDCAPQIDTICDTADSAVYHYSMIAGEIDQWKTERSPVGRTAYVERVPANHRFASSVAYLFDGPIAYGKPKQRRRP